MRMCGDGTEGKDGPGLLDDVDDKKRICFDVHLECAEEDRYTVAARVHLRGISVSLGFCLNSC